MSNNNRQFKVGDRVRCSNEGFSLGSLKKDDIYTIREIADACIYLKGVDCGWCESRFELVEESVAPFKPGDIVECVNSGMYSCIFKGNKYIIHSYTKDSEVKLQGINYNYPSNLFKLAAESTTSITEFYIDTDKNSVWEEFYQKLLFQHEIQWRFRGKSCLFSLGKYIHVYLDSRFITCTNIPRDTGLVFNPVTDVAKIMDLIKVPAKKVIQPPMVHGCNVEYSKNSSTVKFGYTELSVEMLEDISRFMNEDMWMGNRKIISIILDSGKVLNRDNVRNILDYVKEVNESRD